MAGEFIGTVCVVTAGASRVLFCVGKYCTVVRRGPASVKIADCAAGRWPYDSI